MSGAVPALADGKPAILCFEALVRQITERCGAEAASLFAEPVPPAGGKAKLGVISWYGLREGAVLEIDTMDEVAKQAAIARLQQRLAALEPVMRDPRAGPAPCWAA